MWYQVNNKINLLLDSIVFAVKLIQTLIFFESPDLVRKTILTNITTLISSTIILS